MYRKFYVTIPLFLSSFCSNAQDYASKYSRISDFEGNYYSGYYAWAVLNNKYGIINKEGREIVPFKYDRLTLFKNDVASVNENDKWGFVNIKGQLITPIKYDKTGLMIGGFAPVRLGGKWGFIDKTGKEVIVPKFEEVYQFSNNKAAFKQNGKWGFIDELGQVVVQPIYTRVENYHAGVTTVWMNQEDFTLDGMGNKREFNVKTICPIPNYQKIKEVCGAISLNEQVEDEELDYYIFGFEKRMLQIACADPKTENPDVVREKLRIFWERNHSIFGCQYQENILKYAYERFYSDFARVLVATYGININVVDKYDGKNLYDYLKDEYFNTCVMNGTSHALSAMYKKYLKEVYQLGGRSGPKSDWGPGRKVRGYINSISNSTPANSIAEIIDVDVDVAEIKVKIISADEKFKPNGISLSKGMELWLPVEHWKIESQ